jgi:hypothetical protein
VNTCELQGLDGKKLELQGQACGGWLQQTQVYPSSFPDTRFRKLDEVFSPHYPGCQNRLRPWPEFQPQHFRRYRKTMGAPEHLGPNPCVREILVSSEIHLRGPGAEQPAHGPFLRDLGHRSRLVLRMPLLRANRDQSPGVPTDAGPGRAHGHIGRSKNH